MVNKVSLQNNMRQTFATESSILLAIAHSTVRLTAAVPPVTPLQFSK